MTSVWVHERRNIVATLDQISSKFGIRFKKNHPLTRKKMSKNVSQNVASQNISQRKWRKAHRYIKYIRYVKGRDFWPTL